MASVSELENRVGGSAGTARNAPVIVIGYQGSGMAQLRRLLSGFPELACTQGTGILPLCHQVVSVWQRVDRHGGEHISPLAAASARSLSGSMVTAILARAGGSRWCEFTAASPAAARTFALLYPGTRFLMVYRRADTATRAILGLGRWGLEGQEFAPFVSAHPASPVAALASYWVTHTAWQLEFEQASPGVCYRVDADDLIGGTPQDSSEIREFLGLGGPHVSPLFADDDAGSGPDGTGVVLDTPGLPLDRIPAPLLAQVNDLHRRLGYSSVPDAAGLGG